MPCEHIAGAIICTRGNRRHNCQFCSRYATKQCDFPIETWRFNDKGRKVKKQTTCDAWLCDRCAVSQGTEIDYCPPHERNKLKIMEARLRGQVTEEPPLERIVERL